MHSLREAEARACDAGCMPARYARNANTLCPTGQARLLRSTVLLVGLGGLGGWLCEMLARMGVGHIIGVDGDAFEESNANRQLFATQATLGQSKAAVACERVALVNPAVYFEPVPTFIRGEDFAPLLTRADVVADALGGLQDRAALYHAAVQAGKIVVGAGIAGVTGWVATARPHEKNPVHALFDNILKGALQHSVEAVLGNLAPAVAMAASLQCLEIVKILLESPPSAGNGLAKSLRGMVLFDMNCSTLTQVRAE